MDEALRNKRGVFIFRFLVCVCVGRGGGVTAMVVEGDDNDAV